MIKCTNAEKYLKPPNPHLCVILASFLISMYFFLALFRGSMWNKISFFFSHFLQYILAKSQYKTLFQYKSTDVGGTNAVS